MKNRMLYISLVAMVVGTALFAESNTQKEHQLRSAAQRGDVDQVSRLLEDKVNINATDSLYGTSALMLAAEKGYIDIVRLLLKNDAIDVHLQDDLLDSTALDLATENEHFDIVRLLKEKGAQERSDSLSSDEGALEDLIADE